MSARPRIALVIADFDQEVMKTMKAAALDEIETSGVVVAAVRHVPGCYEVPLIAQQLLRNPNVDAAVVLGFIERGHTLHGEVMGHVVHRALMDMSLASGKPIGLGIIGPGATGEQAAARKDPYARAAVKAALAALAALADQGST